MCGSANSGLLTGVPSDPVVFIDLPAQFQRSFQPQSLHKDLIINHQIPIRALPDTKIALKLPNPLDCSYLSVLECSELCFSSLRTLSVEVFTHLSCLLLRRTRRCAGLRDLFQRPTALLRGLGRRHCLFHFHPHRLLFLPLLADGI